jgi:hypothetical protein
MPGLPASSARDWCAVLQPQSSASNNRTPASRRVFSNAGIPLSVDRVNKREDIGCANDVGDHKYDEYDQQYTQDITAGVQVFDALVDARQFTITQAVSATGNPFRVDAQCQ